MIKKKPKLSRAEINERSRLLKRKKKHKGLPSGSRISPSNSASNEKTTVVSDPRVGSKKPIPLFVETTKVSNKAKNNISTVKPRKLPPELELQELENNPYLDELLDMIESDQKLTPKQQQDLDIMLDRIDELMNLLGYTESDENQRDELDTSEDIVSLLRKR